MESNNMQIIFTGDRSQIDAKTLIKFLSHFQNIVAAVDRELNNGAEIYCLKVNAIEKGSFILDLSLVEIFKRLFSSETVGYIANYFSIVTNLFTIYKVAKEGLLDSPKMEVNITVNHNTINVTNIYNNPIVKENLSGCVKAAGEDENVDGIIINDGNGKRVVFDRKLLKNCCRQNNLPQIEVAMLEIIELSFERGGHWKFNYNGNEIDVVVDNEELMNKIEEGERFGKGDAIRVRLQYDPMYRSYQIISYLGHFVSNGPNGKCDGLIPEPKF